MTYLAFAGSPNQLICIKEYLYQKEIKNYEIYFLLSKNSRVNNELEITAKILKLQNIKRVKRSNLFIIRIFETIIFLLNILIIHRKKKLTFIISDFLNNFFHILRILFKTSKFILIDDGFATFWIFKKYLNKKKYYPENQYELNSNLFKIIYYFNYDKLNNPNIQLFTVFAKILNLKKVNFNKLTFCKSLFRKNKKSYDKNLVYVVGTKFYESGIISLEDEIKSITKIKKFWQKKSKKVIYVAKRTTSTKKIELIKKKLNISTIYNNLPLELYLIYKNKIPSSVCSFGSGADIFLPELFRNINNYLIIDIDSKKYEKKKYFSLYEKYFKMFFKKYHKKNRILKL